MANRTTIKGNFQTGDTPTQANFEEFIDSAVLDGATAKTTPIDADSVALLDSADSNALKLTTWANVKAVLKTYFDTLYLPLTGAGSLKRYSGIFTIEIVPDPPNPDTISITIVPYSSVNYSNQPVFTVTENSGTYTARLTQTGQYANAQIASVSYSQENSSPTPFVPIWFDTRDIIIPQNIVDAGIGNLFFTIEGSNT